MGLKPDVIDEIGTTCRPLIEVPIPLSVKVSEVLVGLFLAGTIPVLVGGLLYLHLIEPLLRPLPALYLCILFLGHLAAARSCLVRASRPEFAVGKDGIRLPIERRPAWSSPWSLRDLGLYAWQEVSYCRWSRHVPGLLQIQVMGTQSLLKWEQPPTRLTYQVSEPYRPAVEKAIRAMGKWAD